VKAISVLISLFSKIRSRPLKPLKKARVLFVLKRRSYGPSFGLFNSCNFIKRALTESGHEAHVVEVVDNNAIDREVHTYRPTHVVIEALWVVPEKLSVLMQLHPNVVWAVRLHSHSPFLSGEGMAFDWLHKYRDIAYRSNETFAIAANDCRMCNELDKVLITNSVYLPNLYAPALYDEPVAPRVFDRSIDTIRVSCFGAIRPLKNQLNQAIAAIMFAEQLGKKLEFHVNAGRVEQHSDTVVRNLRSLFKCSRHDLVEHKWMAVDEFIEVVQTMDIGMQVSFSETFNIVAADHIFHGVPVIGSYEIQWLFCGSKANPTQSDDIVRVLRHNLKVGTVAVNQLSLKRASSSALKSWITFIEHDIKL
jgi:hypothetical protein